MVRKLPFRVTLRSIIAWPEKSANSLPSRRFAGSSGLGLPPAPHQLPTARRRVESEPFACTALVRLETHHVNGALNRLRRLSKSSDEGFPHSLAISETVF